MPAWFKAQYQSLHEREKKIQTKKIFKGLPPFSFVFIFHFSKIFLPLQQCTSQKIYLDSMAIQYVFKKLFPPQQLKFTLQISNLSTGRCLDLQCSSMHDKAPNLWKWKNNITGLFIVCPTQNEVIGWLL